MVKLTLAVFLLFVAYAVCDLYMQNPRGSNDRLNEANTNRNNGNRLFDSQNNAKGGYCIGPQMRFYEGSQLSVEWTNQHGCGSNPKLVCNLVIQYMCGSTNDPILSLIRDGTSTNTIVYSAEGAATLDTTVTPNVPLYGMHESYQSYADCNTRDRNMGLYIADRAVQGGLTAARQSSIYTRQNNNGAQNGFECPEERDYYPYWHPAQWKDIAILTTNTAYCDFYKANSQNVLAKGYCQSSSAPGIQTEPNNQADCVAQANQWVMQAPWDLSAPDCQVVPWSRENQLGNGVGGFPNTYNMTIPQYESCTSDDSCVCVLRMRYNISSVENGYNNMNNPDQGFIDWTYNGNNSVMTQNPTLSMGYPSPTQVTLAADTTQFGRTFQDRSHTFKISKRPSGISNTARMYNLNVRGKRGNIVQTYPATEYDFVPQYLYTRVGDYIHFQWTGCDQNPAGNAGEGTDQTDRSNIAQIPKLDANLPVTDQWISSNPSKVLFTDPNLRLRFITLDQTGCLTASQITADGGNAAEDVRNCGLLNSDNAIYFDGGVIKMNKTGTFYYMSTRNHNFTNRDQKGVIYVVPLLPSWALGIVIAGAALFGLAGVVAGLMFYAKSHPHSGVANLFSKM
jgi:hypothetical protein